MIKINQAYGHLKTVLRHKKIVFEECRACGITLQGVLHDMSKFSLEEFIPSALYFQSRNDSPNDEERIEVGYSNAWLHHKSHNKHHWEYWTDFDENGNVIPIKIPSKYVIEMVCDWIGAGKVYSKEKWTTSSPIEYYYAVRKGRYFHKDTEELIIKLLEIIRDNGLEEFHKVCRNYYPIFTDYDGVYIP